LEFPEPNCLHHTGERHVLIAYTVSLDLIRSLRPVVEQLAHYNAEAVKQVTDAANSITHNLGEGSRRSGRDVRRFFVMAHGSASEVRAALDVADAWGWKVDTAASRAILDRLLALLWGLTRERAPDRMRERAPR